MRFITKLLSAALLVAGVWSARAETIAALTSSNELLIVDSAKPATILNRLTISGLLAGENILAMDVRPADGRLYGVTNFNRLYTIGTLDGAAVFAASIGPSAGDAFIGLVGTRFGIDFDPVNDKLRVISDAGQNLRINPDTGLVTTDTNVGYATTDPLTGQTPLIADIAFNNNDNSATKTTLFALDDGTHALVRVGGPNGTPAPSGGQLAMLGTFGQEGITSMGFDIAPDGTAYVVERLDFISNANASRAFMLASVDLATGRDQALGYIGDGTTPIADIAVIPSVQFSASLFAIDKTKSKATITITRTGPMVGTVSVRCTTSDGTARDGIDYQFTSSTITFTGNDASQNFTVPIINDGRPTGDLTVNLTLSLPTGGVALGAPAGAVLRINGNHIGVQTGPSVLHAGLTGPSFAVTGVVIAFNDDMETAAAKNPANFSLLAAGNGRHSIITFTSAIYDPVARTTTLEANVPFNLPQFKTLKLVARGQTGGLANEVGIPLNSKNGHSGRDSTFVFQVQSGINLSLRAAGADEVLNLSGGGRIDAIVLKNTHQFQFQAWLVDTVPLVSRLSVNTITSGKREGVVFMDELAGLGKFDVTSAVTNASVTNTQLTFNSSATGDF